MSKTVESQLNKITNTFDKDLISCGFEQILIDTTIKTLTIPTGSNYAICVLESTATGSAARVLQNRTIQVSSTVGIPISDGGVFNVVSISNLVGFQITKDQAGVTQLNVEYYK